MTLGVLLCGGLILFMVLTANPFRGDYTSAKIMNGNTGEVCEIEESRVEELLKALEETEPSFSGLHLWTSGYGYRLMLSDGRREKDIVFYDENSIRSGHIKYTTKQNVIQIIESYAKWQ